MWLFPSEGRRRREEVQSMRKSGGQRNSYLGEWVGYELSRKMDVILGGIKLCGLTEGWRSERTIEREGMHAPECMGRG